MIFAAKLLAQRQKTSNKKETSHPAVAEKKEQRTKRVQDAISAGEANPPRPEMIQSSTSAKRVSLLSYPKILELAQNLGSGLPEVLRTASSLYFCPLHPFFFFNLDP